MNSKTWARFIALALLAVLAIPAQLAAQEDTGIMPGSLNSVPLISLPLVPDAVRPGTAGFALTVNGTGFVSGSVVKWNGSARITTFVSHSQLKAAIVSSDVAQPKGALVTVVNPGPGGGTSNIASFEVTRPTASVSLTTSDVAAGSNPFTVVTGDFNGDGKLDLAVVNSGVSIFLGNGDGTFRAHGDYTTGPSPAAVAVGDFNGDGKLDLAVADNGGDVNILLGNGDGTFRPHVGYATGNSPSSVAVGDFNGDGKLDLAVANSGASNGISNVSVLLGKGDGTFDAAVNYSAGFGANSVAVGDFNRDGRLDLVVSNFGTGNVSVLLGKGDGTFQTPVDYGAFIPVSVAVGDFNGDGKLDLAVASIPSGNVGPGTVSILLGKGDGTFQSAVDYSVGSNLAAVAVGDFNGDGKLDLAVANGGGDVSILLGKGDGTFQPPVDYIADLYSYSIAVGDFNRDGRLDMAVADPADSSVSILLQPPLVSGLDAVVEPSNLVFVTQLAGTPSPVQPVRLSNYGTRTLNITSITASGDFIQTNTCGPTLAAGVSCTINVAFKPTQGGTRTGTLTVTDNAPNSPQRVSLSGTGTVVELSPTSLKFACIPEPIGHCTCFPSGTTTLTNVGSTTLSISDVAISGPFTQTNTCGASVTADHSCSINVTWSRSPGSGAVTISDNGGGSPQTVSLEGTILCRR